MSFAFKQDSDDESTEYVDDEKANDYKNFLT